MDIFDEDFIPTQEQWNNLSSSEQEELFITTMQDIFDEETFLNFYTERDAKLFESEKVETEKTLNKLNNKLEYLKGLKNDAKNL